MGRHSKKILVVDDEPDIITMLLVRLKHAGYDVVIARNGVDCIKLARQEKPQLILLDVMLPGKNGYEVCEELQADPNTQKVPIILLTALKEPENKIIGRHLGAVDYMEKPFKINALLSRVEGLIGH